LGDEDAQPVMVRAQLRSESSAVRAGVGFMVALQVGWAGTTVASTQAHALLDAGQTATAHTDTR
jgi:hypothetical protein